MQGNFDQMWPKGPKKFPKCAKRAFWQESFAQRAHLGGPYTLCCVPTLVHCFQSKRGPLGQFMWGNGYFLPTLATFCLLRTTFGTFWVWKMGQTGYPECSQCRSNLVQISFHLIRGHIGPYCENAIFLAFFGAFLGQNM